MIFEYETDSCQKIKRVDILLPGCKKEYFRKIFGYIDTTCEIITESGLGEIFYTAEYSDSKCEQRAVYEKFEYKSNKMCLSNAWA